MHVFWPSCTLFPPHPISRGIRAHERARAHMHEHTDTGSSSSKEYNVTSLSLHSLIIRGDGWFSGFLRISAECYRVRMDSFRAVCLPSALSPAQTLKVSPFSKEPNSAEISRPTSPPESFQLTRGTSPPPSMTPIHTVHKPSERQRPHL